MNGDTGNYNVLIKISANLQSLCSVDSSEWTQNSQNPKNLHHRYGLIAMRQLTTNISNYWSIQICTNFQ